MWKTVKLGEICEISIGKTPSRGNKRFWDKEKKTDNVWLSIADLTALSGKCVSDSKEYVSDEGAKLFKPVQQNTLVMSFKLSIGKLAFTERELRTNEAIAALPIKDESRVSKEFLYHYLSSLDWGVIAGNDEKVKGKTLNKKKLNALEVILPPLAEQQRIVAKLDAAFAEIDKKTKTALEKIENAYSFERNILDAALSGIDTTKHRYTLQQLLDMGWIKSHLDGNHGSDYPRKTEFIDEGVPYISANCVIDGKVVMGKAKYLSADRAAQLRKGIARNGDVLFAHNATVGPTAILHTSEEKVILGTSLTYFRCNDETVSNEYLLVFMRSRQFIKQYNEVMRQATRNQVPITKQRTFTFLIPEIDVQHKVAKTVGTLSELTAEFVRATDASNKQLNALKASILAQELQPPQSEAA